MKCRFFLDVVVGECAAIFQLLSGEDQSLLVRWDTLLVLNLGLDGINGIRRLDLEGDGLSGKGLDEVISPHTRRRYDLVPLMARLSIWASAMRRDGFDVPRL